jgi:hypothetical protein
MTNLSGNNPAAKATKTENLAILSTKAQMTDRQASELEIQAALAFWIKYHNQGSRRRVRAAIKYFRKYH